MFSHRRLLRIGVAAALAAAGSLAVGSPAAEASPGRWIFASLTSDNVGGVGWTDSTVQITIDDVDGVGIVGPVTVDTAGDAEGGFNADPDQIGNVDLTPGDIITVKETGSSSSETLTLAGPLTAELSLDGLTASGIRPTGDSVSVLVSGPTCPESTVDAVLVGDDEWTLDIAPICPAGFGGTPFIQVVHRDAEDNATFAETPADLVTVEPARFLDTRPTGSTVDGMFLGAGKVQAGEFTKVMIAGRGDVPSDAVGVEVNITAIQHEGRGFATLYPCTDEPPTASSLNYIQGVNIANATLVALNDVGEVCVFTNTTAHYALDVVAYANPSSHVVTVDPGRFLDTRSNGSTIDSKFVGTGKVQAGEFTKVKIAGRGEVPSDAIGIEVNVTAIQNEGRGFATLFPCGDGVPTASSLNYTPGVNIANATTVALSPAGEVCLFTSTTAHYALDVLAYVAPISDLFMIEPGRYLDTRDTGETIDGLFVALGKVEAGTSIEVDIGGREAVPPAATGIEVNITAIQPEERGYATLYPCTDEPPTASSLNYTPNVNIANATMVALTSGGQVCLFSNRTAHYALDVLAWQTG